MRTTITGRVSLESFEETATKLRDAQESSPLKNTYVGVVA